MNNIITECITELIIGMEGKIMKVQSGTKIKRSKKKQYDCITTKQLSEENKKELEIKRRKRKRLFKINVENAINKLLEILG